MMNVQRTSLFLMANLGAEVSRIISARDRKENGVMTASLRRADKMIEEIMMLEDMKPRKVEVELLSNAIRSIIEPSTDMSINTKSLQDYFTPFIDRFTSTR